MGMTLKGFDKPRHRAPRIRAQLIIACILLAGFPTSTGFATASLRIHKRKLPPDLAEIFARMSDVRKRLKTLSANLEYTKVSVLVHYMCTESGQLFFHKSENQDALLKIVHRYPKTILIKLNRAGIYIPKISQIQK